MVDELILKQSILEGNTREILKNIKELQDYQSNDNFVLISNSYQKWKQSQNIYRN